MKFKIAIVGSRETVASFSLLGADVVPVQDEEQALEELFRLKRTMQKDEQGIERNAYAVVFVLEELLSNLSADDERKLARGALPAIIPLPGHRGSTGLGQARLKHIVERAIGSDILQ